MKCPRCQHEWRLTVRQYLGAPFGRHTCLECAGRFKLCRGISYVLLTFIVCFVTVGIPFALVTILTENFGVGFFDSYLGTTIP